MTTIDHRILIPAPPQVVWEYISNLSRNPKWQVDCDGISFLTEKHDGPGTRWRCTTARGHEHVLEITAWYNGLGYEYVYVDGPGYEENRGRLRLQEIPEGTIVQWTFTYTLGGLLGGMRDTLGKRREIDSTMADSLRKLYTQLKTQSALSMTPQGESKALMREAPDVEARANYQPRHPSVMQEHFDPEKTVPTSSLPKAEPIVNEPPVAEDDARELHGVIIPEPLVTDEDTRPNPIIRREPVQPETAQAGEAPADTIPAGEEPEFLNDLAEVEAEVHVEAEHGVEVEPAASTEPESALAPGAMPPVEETRRYEPRADETRKANVRESAEVAPVLRDSLTETPAAAAEAQEAPDEVRNAALVEEAAAPQSVEAPVEPAASQPSAPSAEETRKEREPDALPPLPPAADPDTTRLIDFPAPAAEAAPQPFDASAKPAAEQEQVEEQSEASSPAGRTPQAPPVRELKPWEEATVSTSHLPSEPAKMDTATMSIWDIFGVQRPSETQELKAVVASAKAEPQGSLPAMRVGRRMALRRKLVNVRRP